MKQQLAIAALWGWPLCVFADAEGKCVVAKQLDTAKKSSVGALPNGRSGDRKMKEKMLIVALVWHAFSLSSLHILTKQYYPHSALHVNLLLTRFHFSKTGLSAGSH